MTGNNKQTNRELIQLLGNDLKHIQRRVDRIEWWQGALVLAYVAGWVTLVINAVVGG